MDPQSIIEQFFIDSDTLYDRKEKWTAEEKQVLLRLEESLIRFQQDLDMAYPPPGFLDKDLFEFENRIASFLDRVLHNPSPGVLAEWDSLLRSSPEYAGILQKVSRAVRKQKEADRPVPAALLNLVQKELSVPAGESSKTPSIVVRLARGSMQVVKSTLQGFYMTTPLETVPVRSSATKEKSPLEEGYVQVELERQVEHSRILTDLYLESEGLLTLSIRLPGVKGDCRLNLKLEDRLVDSRILDEGNRSAVFRSLEPGLYEVSIVGCMKESFRILVHGDDAES